MACKHEDLISCLQMKNWTQQCTSVTATVHIWLWCSLTVLDKWWAPGPQKGTPLNTRWRGWRDGHGLREQTAFSVSLLTDSKQSGTWALRDPMPLSELHRCLHSNVHTRACTHAGVWPLAKIKLFFKKILVILHIGLHLYVVMAWLPKRLMCLRLESWKLWHRDLISSWLNTLLEAEITVSCGAWWEDKICLVPTYASLCVLLPARHKLGRFVLP